MRNYKIADVIQITLGTIAPTTIQEEASLISNLVTSLISNLVSEITITPDNFTVGLMVLATRAGIAKIQPRATNHQQHSATEWEETTLVVTQPDHADSITK